MPKDPYQYFRIEARELLEGMGKAVLELENGAPVDQVLPKALRLAHTLKGAARVVKQPAIAQWAHQVEDALAPLREGPAVVAFDEVLGLLDQMGTAVTALGPAAPPLAGPAQRDSGSQTPRAGVEARSIHSDGVQLDALLSAVVETSVGLATVRKQLANAARARQLGQLLAIQLEARTGAPSRPQRLAGELLELVGDLERRLSAGVEQTERELVGVRETTERLRLVPAATVFPGLERTLRDVARAQKKSATLVVRGGQVRLDAHVLGAVQTALVQWVRNAAAHGLEPEAQRRAAGKPSQGTVTLEVERRGAAINFSCHDDGRGIDLEAVRRAAQAGPVSSDALLERMLAGGFTTSQVVTQEAGRGIGLDLVREVALELGGKLKVSSTPALGTRFELSVPVSLSSLDVLLVEVAGTKLGVPLDCVRAALRPTQADVVHSPEGEGLVYGDAWVPLAPLARLMGASVEARGATRMSALVLEDAGKRVAVSVDRVWGMAHVVMRALPAAAAVDKIVAGASLDAAGAPQAILDPAGLVAAVLAAPRMSAAVAGRVAKPLLVIDDSMTTRMLEQSILESAGYRVEVASSAEEGLDKARRGDFGAFLVDVEMPGMDGFGFLEQVRADIALRHIPGILVTSRNEPEDRLRAEQVGARAYVVKSEFDQAQLLATIARLVAA